MVIKTVLKKIHDLIAIPWRLPAPGQVLVVKATTANTSPQILHTVTSGKTFYLLGVMVQMETNNKWFSISLDGGSTYSIFIGGEGYVTSAKSTNILYTGAPIGIATSGTEIKADSQVTVANDHVTIWGWEE